MTSSPFGCSHLDQAWAHSIRKLGSIAQKNLCAYDINSTVAYKCILPCCLFIASTPFLLYTNGYSLHTASTCVSQNDPACSQARYLIRHYTRGHSCVCNKNAAAVQAFVLTLCGAHSMSPLQTVGQLIYLKCVVGQSSMLKIAVS